MRRLCQLFPPLILAAGPAFAATDIGAAVRACRAETDDARRLACYDRVTEGAHAPAPTSAAAPKSAAPATAAPVAASAAAAAPVPAAATAEDNFGRERQAAAEEQKRQQDEARALGELEAYVTGIETRMDGLMTMTLDNGQVWRQNSPDSKFHLKEGDRIKIQPGSMKSFILSGPSKKSTRVTRVK
jgi:hypothetical protein